MTAILFEEDAPETVGLMRDLVASGYYEGRAFGRVIPTFVIQEVDRTGGTTDQERRVPLEAATRVMFSAGAFGIARDADPDSGGSEFFVMDHAISSLYGNYTAFAQVVEGMDVVHAIARVPAVRTGPASAVGTPSGSPLTFGVHDRVPVDPVVMTKVELVEMTLPASEAARYPLVVGETTRTETTRATLEWDRNIRVGAPATLTWYVATRDASPAAQARDPPDADVDGVQVLVDGREVHFERFDTHEPEGVVSFTWTPEVHGDHTLTLRRGAEELAAATVPVGN